MNKTGACIVSVLLGMVLPAFAAERPNVVLMLADDGGYSDFGFVEGADPELTAVTPNMTRLAKGGAIFTNAYVTAPMCGPSRAGLLTGRYQQRFGHEMNMDIGCELGMPESEPMISERLNPLGYKSAVVGKWGIGYRKSVWPMQRAWDYSFVFLRGQRDFYPIKSEPLVSVFIENNEPQPEAGYSTDRIGEKSIQFIRENKHNPFFLFVSFNAVHTPLQPRKTDMEMVNNFKSEKRGKYAGLMKAMDDNVGGILDELETQGLTENTLVIFISDNGGAPSLGASNGTLRGQKGDLYEGGIRVPCSMTWPGRIKPGTVIHEPIISLDILPTVIGLTGSAVDPAWKLDGIDLMPLLTGAVDTLDTRTLYWRMRGNKGWFAIRRGDWKIYHRKDSDQERIELYNLASDRSEKNNMAKLHPEVTADLMKQLNEWNRKMAKPLFRDFSDPAFQKFLEEKAKARKTKQQSR